MKSSTLPKGYVVAAAIGTVVALGGAAYLRYHRRRYTSNKQLSILHSFWRLGYKTPFSATYVDQLSVPVSSPQSITETKAPATTTTTLTSTLVSTASATFLAATAGPGPTPHPYENAWAFVARDTRHRFQKSVNDIFDGIRDSEITWMSGRHREPIPQTEKKIFLDLYARFIRVSNDDTDERQQLYAAISELFMKWRYTTGEYAFSTAEASVAVGTFGVLVCGSKAVGIF